jgi:hypothetical protein
MDGACSTHGGYEKYILSGNLKGRYNLGHLGIGGRIILN